MTENTLVSLIRKSPLISSEMRVHLLGKIAGWSEAQQQEMTDAIRASEKDLEQILDHAITNDPARLVHIQQKLDDVWKQYVKEVEGISESAETTQEQALLDRLDHSEASLVEE